MEKKLPMVGRRQFIATSALVVAATAVGPKLFAGDDVAMAERVAVGYAPFDDGAPVSAAAAVPAGDGGFISRGARISLSGVSGAPAEAKARRAVELQVRYSYLDGAVRREAPFRAWACNRTTGCQGCPISFTVPVDEVQRISLGVGVERDRPARVAAASVPGKAQLVSGDALPVALTLASGADTLKLVRGFYVIVPLFDKEPEPAWSLYHIERLDGRWALHDRFGNGAPFEHFVMRIDYAPAKR